MKIILRMAGGLGNQLFQIATLLELRDRYGGIIYYTTDSLSDYSTVRTPDFEKVLDIAALQIQPSPFAGLNWLASRLRFGRILPFLGRGDRNAKRDLVWRPRVLFVDGYLQHHWTTERLDKVRRELLSHCLLEDVQTHRNVCAIHIRGGDFLVDPKLNIVGFNWYVGSVRRMLADCKPDMFSILSDDSAAARALFLCLEAEFPHVRFEIVSKDSPEDDFNYLRCSNLRIIGNSTFGIWAALLSPLPTSKTIAHHMLFKHSPRPWTLPTEV